MPGNEDKVGYWITPPELMASLEAEFHFNFDPCPFPRPAGFDGLKEDWGARNWVNPPFVGTSAAAWTKKAIEERDKGKLVVMIFPVDRWLTRMVTASAEIRVPPPFHWLNPRGKPQPAPRPHLLFILRPKL